MYADDFGLSEISRVSAKPMNVKTAGMVATMNLWLLAVLWLKRELPMLSGILGIPFLGHGHIENFWRAVRTIEVWAGTKQTIIANFVKI